MTDRQSASGEGPDRGRPEGPSVRRILVVVLGLNLFVALAKLLVGWLSSSLSMVADGFHSLTDSASNVVGLIGISVGRRPPDEDHPYGHRKFETLAALLIGALLALTAWEVLKGAIHRLRAGGAPEVTWVSFAVMIGTILINLAVSTYEARKGRELGSAVLDADAAHTRSDVYSSLAVIVSLVAARAGYPQLDVVAALVITMVIARAAFTILKENGMVLTDTALLPAGEIRELALTVPGVESVHKIRSRGGHGGGGYADLHIQVAADMSLDRAHVLAHLVSQKLTEELGLKDVLVHVEPPVGHKTDWRPDELNPS